MLLVLLFYASPAISAQTLREDVVFLCDSARLGRRFGGRGVTDAAFYVQREFRQAGLEVSVRHFSAGGRVGHNVEGLLRVPGASKYIVVMANMDGLGEYGGVQYPGADANASGTAALIELARTLRADDMNCNVLFVALDGHNENLSGAEALLSALKERGLAPDGIRMVVNLDTMGSTMAPPQRYWKEYLIILGGEKYGKTIMPCNEGLRLHLYFDYYGSRPFTDMFYRKVGDQSVFVAAGIPSVMVTSGITMLTNKPGDEPSTLNWDVFGRRVELVRRWLQRL